MGSFTFSPCEYILNVSHPQPSAAAALPLGEDLHASEAISFCTPVFSSTRIFQILICYGSPLTTINCQRLADFFLLLFLVGYMFWCSFRNENRHKSLHFCKELFIFFLGFCSFRFPCVFSSIMCSMKLWFCSLSNVFHCQGDTMVSYSCLHPNQKSKLEFLLWKEETEYSHFPLPLESSLLLTYIYLSYIAQSKLFCWINIFFSHHFNCAIVVHYWTTTPFNGLTGFCRT